MSGWQGYYGVSRLAANPPKGAERLLRFLERQIREMREGGLPVVLTRVATIFMLAPAVVVLLMVSMVRPLAGKIFAISVDREPRDIIAPRSHKERTTRSTVNGTHPDLYSGQAPTRSNSITPRLIRNMLCFWKSFPIWCQVSVPHRSVTRWIVAKSPSL